MRYLVDANQKLLAVISMLALLLLLGACSNNDTRPLPPIIPTTPTTPGGGFVGGGGSCGGASGFPIGRDQNTAPYYANLFSQYGGGYGFNQSSMNLSVGWADQTSNNILGSVQLNVDLASLLGYPPGSLQQQQVCASSNDPFTGQVTYGSGYNYGTAFVIQQLVLTGVVNVPTFQNQQIPMPITVVVGGSCQTTIDFTSRRVSGCVTMIVGNQQQYIYIAQ